MGETVTVEAICDFIVEYINSNVLVSPLQLQHVCTGLTSSIVGSIVR